MTARLEAALLGFLTDSPNPAAPKDAPAVLEAVREAMALIDAHENARRQLEAEIPVELERAKDLGFGLVLDLRPGSMAVHASHLVVAGSAIVIAPPSEHPASRTPTGMRL